MRIPAKLTRAARVVGLDAQRLIALDALRALRRAVQRGESLASGRPLALARLLGELTGLDLDDLGAVVALSESEFAFWLGAPVADTGVTYNAPERIAPRGESAGLLHRGQWRGVPFAPGEDTSPARSKSAAPSDPGAARRWIDAGVRDRRDARHDADATRDAAKVARRVDAAMRGAKTTRGGGFYMK